MKIPSILTTPVGLIAVGLVALMLVKKNFPGLLVGVAADAVGAAGEVAGGVVVGIGELVGIPRTDETECEAAMRQGRTWDASFACPAGTYLKYLWK